MIDDAESFGDSKRREASVRAVPETGLRPVHQVQSNLLLVR